MYASGDPDQMAIQRARFRAYAAADPLGWFERLYAEAETAGARIPWDLGDPDPLLEAWLRDRLPPAGTPATAIVVGCGLGRDAELVASVGFETTAFDISETAIRMARRRSAGRATVRYLVANLLDPPAAWERAFDLVVECITVQALPASLRARAIRRIGELVAEGGTLIVVALRQPEEHLGQPEGQPEVPPGPPWPLTRSEIEAFAASGLEQVRVEELLDPTYAGRRDRWRAEFRRP